MQEIIKKLLRKRHCRINGHKDPRYLVENNGNPDNEYYYCAYCETFRAAWINDIKWSPYPPPPKPFTKLVD